MTDRVRVMFLAANPYLDLKINDEVRDIRTRIRESVFRGAELVYEPATRAGDLIGRLDEHRPHVVHFSGHGTEAHELILLDERGAPVPVRRELLAELFRLCRDNLRIVFLNFCHSLPIAEEIRGVVDCVIGTTDAIPDQAARFFAAQFYGSLSSGRTVLESFERATLQLKLQGLAGGEVLRLLHADGVDPGQIRIVEHAPIPDVPPETEAEGEQLSVTGSNLLRDGRGRRRSAIAEGAAWRWVESNSELLTIAGLALTIALIAVAAAGSTAVGLAVVAADVAAAGGWIAYRLSVRHREAGRLAETARRNVIDRPGFFRVRPYDDAEEDQQLFDRADGAHEEVLRWLRDPGAPVLFLSGLSGTGKSSLLYAYVLPRLRREAAPGRPSRDLGPAGPEAGSPSPAFRVVVLRNYDDPTGQLDARLGELAPEATGAVDPRDRLRRASGPPDGRLLLVLDQFEQLLIAREGNAARFEPFLELLRSLGREPIPGVTVLIALRGDYLGFLDEQGLGTVTLNENLRIIKAFRPQDARAFLARSGLRVEPELLSRVVDELAEVERTEGLIRPITLNMLGLALTHRSAAAPATLPPVEEVLTDYCRACISRPAIGPYAPAVLRPMISRVETIQPRTVADLARRTGLRPAVVRGVLLNLGNDGLVRRVDAAEDLWEVSHDFVAHLLAELLRRSRALRLGVPVAAAVAVLVGVLYVATGGV